MENEDSDALHFFLRALQERPQAFFPP